MVLPEALGFAREHSAREVRGKAPGEQPQGLLRHDLAIRWVGGRPQGFGEAHERALVLEPRGTGGGERLDEEEMSERRLGREEIETRAQSS